ncbi:MAG: radical SAM protein, partial [Fibrobacter sp.]|nr:radical SAM protein [Fibrobacter sp.]
DNDKKECDGCALKHRCVAHECACTSFYTTGSVEGVSPEVCTHERMLTEITDALIEKLG